VLRRGFFLIANKCPISTVKGGIDKYFKEFPDGGYWKGKNYVFDKRFAHPPPAVQAAGKDQQPASVPSSDQQRLDISAAGTKKDSPQARESATMMGKCEVCGKPWDMYRGKRRCPTCGVPSLVCRDCWRAHEDGTRKIDKSVRCDLCVEQNIRSKHDLRERERREIERYEAKLAAKGLLKPAVAAAAANPDNVTRLYLKNMCRKNMTEEVLMGHLDGVTHVVWRTDRHTGNFTG